MGIALCGDTQHLSYAKSGKIGVLCVGVESLGSAGQNKTKNQKDKIALVLLNMTDGKGFYVSQ